VVSFDAVVEAMGAERQMSYGDIMALLEVDAEAKAESGVLYTALVERAKAHTGIVFWDQTNLTERERKKKQELFPDFKKIGVFFDITVEESKRRCEERFERTGKFIPPDVIEKMGEWLAKGFPQQDEFDVLYHRDSKGVMTPYVFPPENPQNDGADKKVGNEAGAKAKTVVLRPK